MPNNASAAKRLRQTAKRRVQNKARKSELRTIRKKLLRAVHDGQKDEATALYQRFTKRVDQATAKGVLHKNTASRDKARLAKHLNEVEKA